ncbi:hypothetical protein FG147_02425 [Thauera sp. UPWRP]|nr:hypothetical protein FG147_02425 [Thauera sp. UPWRP]
MGLIDSLKAWRRSAPVAVKPAERLPNEGGAGLREQGRRATPEASLKYLYRQMWVDPAVRAAILDVREMDHLDGRVRRIHSRIARDVVKGGLVMVQPKESRVLRREWEAFVRRLQLDRVEKLKSDARGLVMEGNIPLQWVLDEGLQVAAGVRMPTETLLPNVTENGQFKDVREAYHQLDVFSGTVLARFSLWQMTLARFDPDNFDDMGCMGRPFLDASREVWRKLRMTEEDLVIRRRTRAPFRMAHILEGATADELNDYRDRVEKDQHEITTDFYMNRKGGVQPVQGDASLGEIGDVVHLLDTFFAGSPLPKGMMGYTDGMARDILEDLKRDYYEEVDVLQDTISFAYAQGFRLHLLLKGMAPDPSDYQIEFAERRTETPNQTTDRMLKWSALGLPKGMVFEEMGFNAQAVKQRLKDEADDADPYPGPAGGTAPPGTVPSVKVTPGNAPKGESATSVGNGAGERRAMLGEHWPEDA